MLKLKLMAMSKYNSDKTQEQSGLIRVLYLELDLVSL